MAMLQALSPSRPGSYEDREQGLDPARLMAIARRRIFYFAIPFVLLLIAGFLIIAIQRPIYHAEGKILVESPEIPTTLVQPTVTAAAVERMQVIQQRIMNRDNLLAIVKKFGLFPSQRKWMSETQLLDLMRKRAVIELVDIDTAMSPTKDGKPAPSRSYNKNNAAVAFTIGFDYEQPELAMKVSNELLTLILNEDVRTRTSRASETTQFLAREVKRLQGDLDTVNGQVLKAKQQLTETGQRPEDVPDQLKTESATLTAMKTDLIQKLSVYSEGHPAIKSLKKRIASLEKEIAVATKSIPASQAKSPGEDVDALAQRQTYLQQALDDANKKFTAARLGESMERDQQAEHLQVIEQPVVPQKPDRPKRLKLFAATFGLAMMAGVGTVFFAEMLDKTIRSSRDLAGVVDSSLLVVIPYISTRRENVQRKRKIIILWTLLAVVLIAGMAVALYIGLRLDPSWLDRSWIDSLTRLSK